MAETSAQKIRENCEAGGSNGASCKNNSLTVGISMHEFPKKVGSSLRKAWIKFVQRHRHN